MLRIPSIINGLKILLQLTIATEPFASIMRNLSQISAIREFIKLHVHCAIIIAPLAMEREKNKLRSAISLVTVRVKPARTGVS